MGDIVGKVTVGYQGWFGCDGDGNPLGDWWHYGTDRLSPPSATNTTLIAWPDMRDFDNKYPTDYADLGNGDPATVFSSWDSVDTHFEWMQRYHIDTAALQRFNPNTGEGPIRDAMAAKVRTAAEATGVKFYIMYDVTNWLAMQTEIKADWTDKMSAYTASPMYAKENGKPVVGIWGFGFNDTGRPFPADAGEGETAFDIGPCLDVILWFRAQGCYVMGGVPTYWRTEDHDSRPGFLSTYLAYDCISPWMVGRIHTVANADTFFLDRTLGDVGLCHENGIHYQPCVLPGDLSLGDRAHGDFMWRQMYNHIRAESDGLYISMFDEFNEGNQIAKTAETDDDLPTDGGFLALDEDGTPCTSDYYLRLTTDGGRMLKGALALTDVRPTNPAGDDEAPSVPLMLAATGHTETTVDLSWTASTDNVGVPTYNLYRAPGASGGSFTQVATSDDNTVTATGLSAGTTYRFRITAVDDADNESAPSNTITVTTMEPEPDPPAPSTGIAQYRNRYTHQTVFLAAPDDTFEDSPRWVRVNPAGEDGDISTHAADTTDVHGITDTELLATLTAAAAADDAVIAAHTADTSSVHGIANTAVLETTTGMTTKVSTHAAASDPHGDRAATTTALSTHAAASDPHGDRAAATSGISTHAAASDPHADRANTTTAIATHAAASDPHADRANTTTQISTHAAASDPHGDRANTTTAIATHAAAADPHGDRAWIDTLDQMVSTRVETLPRYMAQSNTTLTSQALLLGYFTAPSALPYTTLTVCSATVVTAPVNVTLGKLALYSVDGSGNLTLIAAGANNNSLCGTASTLYTATITSGTLTAGARYAIGVLMVADTPGAIRGAVLAPGVTALAPVVAKTVTGQSDIPSSVLVGDTADVTTMIYASIS